MKERASILIVDDDPGTTESLIDILKEMEFQVEVASDGFEAIEKVKTRSFDVIFMDIRMPGMNGVETFREIKDLRSEAAVMMMTAYSVEELVAQALEDGAHGVLYKPLDIEKAVEFLERVEGSPLIASTKVSALTRERAIAGAIIFTRKSLGTVLDKLRESVTKVLPSSEIEIDSTKEEVWDDLSALYYKYEDEHQKRAFREIMCEISEKIQQDKWDTIYKKLYRREKTSASIDKHM